MRHDLEEGALVLADISGFTEFVTATEIEHGPPLIAELLETVIGRISPPLEIQEVGGRSQAAGVDVILVHRLLKNGVAGRAYLLLTERALRWAEVDPARAGLRAHVERYEHLGDVRCFVKVLAQQEPLIVGPAAARAA